VSDFWEVLANVRVFLDQKEPDSLGYGRTIKTYPKEQRYDTVLLSSLLYWF
jgi:hypothetical protein